MPRRRSRDDDWSEEYIATVNGVERGVPAEFLRGTPRPWFAITRQDPSVHNGKVTTVVQDFPSQRDREIEGLGYEFGKPPEPDSRFGLLTNRGY